MPTSMYVKFKELIEENEAKEIKKSSTVRVYYGIKEYLAGLGCDIAEEITNSKKYFKRIELFVQGQNGIFASDMLHGEY
jgi:hypothetical protein